MIASEYQAIDQAAFGLQNRTIALQCITGFYEISTELLSTNLRALNTMGAMSDSVDQWFIEILTE